MILKDKTALITGATGTIGGAIARFFIREGCWVLLSGRSAEQLEILKKELASPLVEICAADVSEIESVKNLTRAAGQTFSALDILVTAAGTYGEIGAVEQCDPEKWLATFRVNALGTMAAIKYALPLLKKSPSAKIITFAGGGEGALPNFSAYASSKGAVLRFTETAAVEIKKFNIAINAISPGLVNSGLLADKIAAGADRVGETEYQESLARASGEKKDAVSPDKAAALAVWLASSASGGLTGKNISAVWDKYEDIPQHLAEIMNSDIYNFRRVKPKDRGYDWK